MLCVPCHAPGFGHSPVTLAVERVTGNRDIALLARTAAVDQQDRAGLKNMRVRWIDKALVVADTSVAGTQLPSIPSIASIPFLGQGDG